jgi:Coenzyme PQQ synthesis protein D (PqqD)
LAELRVRTEALEWRDVEGVIIALDLRASEYLELNHTAAILWHELTRGATFEDLVAALTERFELDRGAAARDVESFLGTLSERDLIES